MSLSCPSFCLFGVSVSLNIIMLILDLGEWDIGKISFLAPTYPITIIGVLATREDILFHSPLPPRNKIISINIFVILY